MHTVREALRVMVGPNVGIGVTDPKITRGLWPEEAAGIANAIPKRQTEFAAGRFAARSALVELGLSAIAIPQGADRAPVWPVGIAGSISHCADCCVAIVASCSEFETLGVDIEPATPLDADLIDIVCTQTERIWVNAQSSPGLAAKLIFSAKEAIYKAQYPITGKVIGFDAVTVTITNDRFAIASSRSLPTMKGAILIQDGLILSVVHV